MEDSPLSRQQIMNANLVIELTDETYICHKNRYIGSTGHRPIEEFPDVVRNFVIQDLKMRDGIWDGEQEDLDDEF